MVMPRSRNWLSIFVDADATTVSNAWSVVDSAAAKSIHTASLTTQSVTQMDKLYLVHGRWTQHRTSESTLTWIDISRDEPYGKDDFVNHTGFSVHENHLKDAWNDAHPPKYENGNDYEILILPTYVITDSGSEKIDQHTFVFSEDTLITIHPADSLVWNKLRSRHSGKRHRPPQNMAELLHSICNALVNEQVNNRGLIGKQLDEFQDRLLGRGQSSKTDWDEFFALQKRLNAVATTTQLQLDSLNELKSETDIELTPHSRIRINDVIEHLQRYATHMESLTQDVQNMLQIYFSITQDKTNNTMRVLTAISVIFLPLNLFAGIFGMNFTKIPGLESSFGFWGVLGAMAITAVALYWTLMRLR